MLLLWSPSIWKPLSTLIGLLKIWVLMVMSLGPCYATCSVIKFFVLKEIAGEMGWSASQLLLYSEAIWLSWGYLLLYLFKWRNKPDFSLFPFFKKLFWNTVFQLVAQEGLRLQATHLPQPSKYQDYSCELWHLCKQICWFKNLIYLLCFRAKILFIHL